MKNLRVAFLLNLISVFLILSISSCGIFKRSNTVSTEKSAAISISTKTYQNGLVVSAHPIASEIGLQILKKGGNAVDAMVAVHFALAVVYPSAGNLGGGGFMVLRDTLGGAYTLDFREKAPLAAHKDMYLDEQGEVIPGLSLRGQKAAGVPGSVDGMIKAHGKFGSLPLRSLLDPAIRLAKRGFEITKQQASDFNQLRQQFITYSSDS